MKTYASTYIAATVSLARGTAISTRPKVVRRCLESAGVDFIDENGGGPGVRLRKRQRAKNRTN